MSFGRTPLPVPEATHYETNQKVERLEFEEDGGGTFIVLHFEAPRDWSGDEHSRPHHAGGLRGVCGP